MQIENIIKFLSKLKENNNREWFAENKIWYERTRNEFEQLSTNLILEISKFDSEINQLEAKDCIFRIYRDTRFSLDKTPYKTHFGVYIASAGGRKSKRGGYYLHLDPAGCFLGVGVWCPDPNLLKSLRQSVYDNIEELNTIRFQPNFKQYFNSFLEENKLINVPKGFPKDFPEAELLKLKHYLVEYKIDETLLKADDFVQKTAEILKLAHPFNQFLNYTVDETINNQNP